MFWNAFLKELHIWPKYHRGGVLPFFGPMSEGEKHFFGIFGHNRLSKSAGRKNNDQKPNIFSEADNMKFYAVLLHLL